MTYPLLWFHRTGASDKHVTHKIREAPQRRASISKKLVPVGPAQIQDIRANRAVQACKSCALNHHPTTRLAICVRTPGAGNGEQPLGPDAGIATTTTAEMRKPRKSRPDPAGGSELDQRRDLEISVRRIIFQPPAGKLRVPEMSLNRKFCVQ